MSNLDAFLKGNGGGEAAPAGETPPESPPPESTPAPESTPPPDADDSEPPSPREGEPTVPRAALEDERHKRRDWKEKAVRAETERDELRRQLEDAKRVREQPQQPPRPLDPAQDPQGYAVHVQNTVLNERLNISELLLRKELGSEKVDAIIAEFKHAAQQDPRLFQQLYTQPHPYEFAAQEVERLRLHREIGDDPAAYEARLRAKWESERTTTAAPPLYPAARIAPSLAAARSVAGRSAPTFTGPTPLEDIVERRRK